MTNVKRLLGVFLVIACVALAMAQQPPAPQIAIGGKVANLKLQTLSGAAAQLHSLNGQNGTLLIFIATKCPVSNDYNERMAALAKDYASRGFAVIGINSNKTEPAEEVSKHATQNGLSFTILKDPDNVVADYFGASFTPEAYLFDRDWTLRYHGRIDDSRNPANIATQDLRTALDALQAGKSVPVTETKAFGCTIKRVAKGS
jgi:peroxiredoxin